MDAKQQLLYERAIELDDRITYFLLTVAAAGIGYAVQKSGDLVYQGKWEVVLASSAILLWGVSFGFGCLKLLAMRKVVQTNLRLLQIAEEIERALEAKVGVEGLRRTFNDLRDSLHSRGAWQRRWFALQLLTLAAGVLAFVGWHGMVIKDQTESFFH